MSPGTITWNGPRRLFLQGAGLGVSSVLLAGVGLPVPERIVSAGASVTEILFALGVGGRVVGRDSSSRYPAASQRLPKVGYHRHLAAEGVLSLAPDLVLVTDEAGPTSVIQQIRQARVRIHTVPSVPTVEGLFEKIRATAKAVAVVARGEKMIARIKAELAELPALSPATAGLKVGFIYARGSGAMLLSGTKTSAAGILKLAGLRNAMTAYEGYKPLSPEGLVAAAPDVLLIPERALGAVKGIDGILAAPGVALTPAGRNKRVVPVDEVLLLGFGPRLPLAIRNVRELVA